MVKRYRHSIVKTDMYTDRHFNRLNFHPDLYIHVVNQVNTCIKREVIRCDMQTPAYETPVVE